MNDSTTDHDRMGPIATAGDTLLDGEVRLERVYKPDDIAAHAYVLSFPQLPANAGTAEVRIGRLPTVTFRKWRLTQAAKRALAEAKRRTHG